MKLYLKGTNWEWPSWRNNPYEPSKLKIWRAFEGVWIKVLVILGKSSKKEDILHADRKRWPPHQPYGQPFVIFLCFWPQIMNICALKRILHKKKAIFWMIICKRPNPPEDHFQEASPSGWRFATMKRAWKIAFHNEIKCVLSTKESNFNGKNGSKFSSFQKLIRKFGYC